ncbi:S-methyl-5-thioribose-1-phosphate isomerase [Mucisphaera calidilacus]|uniref:Methylthioribose-1-phosphate isomerase n=1 Tax=Mucisphaera calidilacus TaxID=2527982 RepID=A0A518BZZ9_9BACT|nr:S-methyl-5-thioribose-1-phosphate isomerase [Mucisphaera calidilacus]QDU72541.1 Methylthioribose-1-phosphate isomerase [Mucisphaera calidilacus]
MLRPIEWVGDTDGHLRLLDQTRLPATTEYIDCTDVDTVWHAIKRLSVRGAPAIGISAAYGCVIGARNNQLDEAIAHLRTSRPTAVNLFWALDRIAALKTTDPQRILDEAHAIADEDDAMCRSIGRHALALIDSLTAKAPDRPLRLITHCNAGKLATGGIGTATAAAYLAKEQGRDVTVYADETRPLLQGARLTAFELTDAGIDVRLICDGAASEVLRAGAVDAAIVGADRIAANGDTANKVGTCGLASLARHHGIPFLVAAPHSTFDLNTATGNAIPIEERAAEEVTEGFGTRTAPPDVRVFNPAFDITPANLITAIVTDQGVIRPVSEAAVRDHLAVDTEPAR